MATAATYRGPHDSDGAPQEFLTGIPARDLSADEWEGLDDTLKLSVLDSPLYSVRGADKERTSVTRRIQATERAAQREATAAATPEQPAVPAGGEA